MTEEKEVVGSKLEHRIAQTKADIRDIDITIQEMQDRAKALRSEQDELKEMLAKLEG